MFLSDSHRFTISLPGGPMVVHPINDKLEYSFEFDEDLCAKRKKLETELIFKNDTKSVMAFDILYTLELEDACHKVDVLIERLCDTGQWVEAFKGLLDFNEADWDCEKCVVHINTIPKDEFSCITDTWDIPKDLLRLETITVSSSAGVLECVECYEPAPSSPIQFPASNPPTANGCGYLSSEGWIVSANLLTGVTQVLTTPAIYQAEVGIRTQYCRYFSTSDPGGWIPVSGGFASPAAVAYNGYTFTSYNELTLNVQILDLEIDNAVTWDTLLDCFDCLICSDFFGINPDGTAPDNVAYQYAVNFLQDIVFVHPTDVIQPSPDRNAIFFNRTFKEIWTDLKKLFDLKMIYDQARDCIRIEHISYGISQKIIDLRKDPLRKFVAGLNSYTKSKEDFPVKESWRYSIFTGNPKYDDANVIYDNDCATGDPVECELEVLGADIVRIYDNQSYIGSDFEKDGVIIIATNGNGVILNNNDPLGLQCIIENLHLWNRPFIEGVMNNKVYTFLSARKLKKQPTIVIPLCCDDYYNEFNCDMNVRSKIGKGAIDKASYLEPECKLELSIIY